MKRPLLISSALLLLPLGLALVLGGCGGGGRQKVPQGSALWVTEASAFLGASDLSDLGGLGVESLFGEAALLEWDGQRPRLTGRNQLEVPRRTPIALVIKGPWRSGLDAAATAEALAEEVRRISLEADAAGIVPAGFHFEVDATGDLESFGRTLEALRDELPRELWISAGVRRAWLEDENLEILTGGVDFFVAWLYGQRPDALRGEGWKKEAWDLGQVDLSLRRVESLEKPYFVGIVTLGMTLHLDRAGGVRDLRPGGLLRPLVRHPALRLDHGFVLTGMDCRRYDFTAERDLSLDSGGPPDPWRVKRGEGVRSLAIGSSRVREYRRLLPALDLRHRLGDLFYRLPAAEDRLSVDLDGFRAALTTESDDGGLAVEVQELRRGASTVVLEVALQNIGLEATEVAFIDRNYLELEVPSGRFGKIDAGDFQRYQLLRRGADGSVRPSLRNADLLRLFEPMLDSGGEVRSGSVEVYGIRDVGNLRWRLNYLLGDGTVLRQASEDSENDRATEP